MSITEFLLARIAEDEERARAAGGAMAWRSDGPGGGEAYVTSLAGERLFEFDMERMIKADRSTLALAEHVAAWLPSRVLAECAAKRRIVELHQPRRQDPSLRAMGQLPACAECGSDVSPRRWPCPTFRAVASGYADHPDYDPAWREG